MRLLMFSLALTFACTAAQATEPLGEMMIRYEGPASVDTQVAYKLLMTCGATFKGVQARKIEQMSAFSDDHDFKTVNIAELAKGIDRLKECSGVQQSGSFFICKKGATYSYFNSSFEKISSQPCDQVVTKGSEIFCLKKQKSEYEVVQSHKAHSSGGATCMQAALFSPEKKSTNKKIQ